MITLKRLLIALNLVTLFSIAGCTTVASQDRASEGGEKNATQRELTGKVVRITPCRTLIEIEAAKVSEGGKNARIQFFCFDPEARESAGGVEKGDTIKIQYVFSPETQRNRVRKITKVTR